MVPMDIVLDFKKDHVRYDAKSNLFGVDMSDIDLTPGGKFPKTISVVSPKTGRMVTFRIETPVIQEGDLVWVEYYITRASAKEVPNLADSMLFLYND